MEIKYATFRQRFSASLIDILVFLPFSITAMLILPTSKLAEIASSIIFGFAFQAYVIYGHGKYGQTIGKAAMGIRVVCVTGERIGWRKAWLRSSVDIAFRIAMEAAMIMTIVPIPGNEYYDGDWMQHAQNRAAHEPVWQAWVTFASTIWFWAEFVVMLLNQQRRALHDFIAGTIVNAEPAMSQAQTPSEAIPV